MPRNKTIERYLQDFSCIIITGASSGIGRELLSRIEYSGTPAAVFNLSRTPPDCISKALKFTHLKCDLSQPAQIESVVAELKKLIPREGRILLINNSGFGAYGEFPSPGIEHTLRMMDVNSRAPVHLTALLWENLKTQGGQVANIASLAGYQPTPLMATYAATKAFLLNWSIALDAEGREFDVQSIAICPGPVSTNFSKAAGFENSPGLGGQTVQDCVEESLQAMSQRRSQVITGWKNRVIGCLSARLSKPFAAKIGLRMIRKLKLDRFVKKT